MAESSSFDVVVIGAGPAGALSALLSARAGARTLLVERAEFPRHKVCGCCLAERGRRVLEEYGIADVVLRGALRPGCARVCVKKGAGEAVGAVVRGVSHMTIGRDVMDAALVGAAVSAGVTFRDGAAAVVDPGGGCVCVLNERVHARVVVVADGLASASLRGDQRFGWRVRRRSRVGVGAVVESGSAAAGALARRFDGRAITMTAGHAGYVGIAALPGERWAIAAAIDPAVIQYTYGGARGAVCDLLRCSDDDADWVGDIAFKGTPALTRRRNRIEADGRVFLVGDAAAYVEPFTGEGMSWAMVGASRLHRHVGEVLAGRYRAGAWTRDARGAARRGQLGCRGVAALLRYPSLAHAAVGLLAARPGLAERLTSLVFGRSNASRGERNDAGWAVS